MTIASTRGQRSDVVKWAAIVLSVLFILILDTGPLGSNDTWLQIRIGQLIVDTGHIPNTVLFPFTNVRDNPFTAHEWVPSILFFEMARTLGVSRLMYVVSAMSLVQFGLSYLLARTLRASHAIALFLATMAMIVANYRFLLRPELFALLFTVCLLLVLERFRLHRRVAVLLWVIPIAIAWCNCHGSFLLGPAIAIIYAAGAAGTALVGAAPPFAARLRAAWRQAAPFAFAAAAMLASSTINPYGWKLFKFAFQLQSSTVIRQSVQEWLPTFSPMFRAEPAVWVFVAVALASLVLIALLWRRLPLTDALLYALFAVMAAQTLRHIVWFGFIALLVCARLLATLRVTERRERQLEYAGCAFALVSLCCCVLLGNLQHSRVYEVPSLNLEPKMIAELADPQLSGNVLNSYELGAELIYRDWPCLRPTIDSRVDSYGDDYLLFTKTLLVNETLLNAFLQGYGVNHMLLKRWDFEHDIKGMPSIQANWHIRLTDGTVYLLERNVPFPVPPLPASPHSNIPEPACLPGA